MIDDEWKIRAYPFPYLVHVPCHKIVNTNHGYVCPINSCIQCHKEAPEKYLEKANKLRKLWRAFRD